MRIRLTVEYDTEETLDYERAAWRTGQVSVEDFLGLEDDDDSTVIRLEQVPERA